MLDALEATDSMTLLIDDAAGGVGTIAAQLARARGLTVIGTASEHNHAFLNRLGACETPVKAGWDKAARAHFLVTLEEPVRHPQRHGR